MQLLPLSRVYLVFGRPVYISFLLPAPESFWGSRSDLFSNGYTGSRPITQLQTPHSLFLHRTSAISRRKVCMYPVSSPSSLVVYTWPIIRPLCSPNKLGCKPQEPGIRSSLF